MEKGRERGVTRLSKTTAKVAFTPCRKNFPEASSSRLSLLYEGRMRDAPIRERSIPSGGVFDDVGASQMPDRKFKRLRMCTCFATVSWGTACVSWWKIPGELLALNGSLVS